LSRPKRILRKKFIVFCEGDTEVILECDGKIEKYTFGELMPYGFKL